MRGTQELNMPPVFPGACERCNHHFPNLDEAGPEIAQYILDQHDQVCSGINRRTRVAQPSTESGVGIACAQITTTSPPQLFKDATAVKAPPPRKRKKYATDMVERKMLLEADEWGREATAKSIVCQGCDKRIRLDKRNDYYPGLWTKHRDKCKEIIRLKDKEFHSRVRRLSRDTRDLVDVSHCLGATKKLD
ncbi:hypothetical protein BDZ94DRAFT_200101 [Collybia nuda]|uniref:Uncharacterized protein n=1 Tax=Collybia nuda TaxID=64659 RepID=A0A9P5XW02_9AGAR|nr:hypothetical protein BDZ94DRAFT_200101 [Collybia nuda]